MPPASIVKKAKTWDECQFREPGVDMESDMESDMDSEVDSAPGDDVSDDPEYL